MTVVRRIARPLLAAPYVADGVDAFRHPGPRVDGARPIVSALAASPAPVPNDPELVVRVAGAAAAGAAVLLALGKLPRLSAVVLVASSAPALRSAHPFWAAKDPAEKRAERALFLKDLGLLGGSILAAVDTAGKPGVNYRTKAAAKEARRGAKGARKAAKLAAHEAALSGALAAKDLQLSARAARKELGRKGAKAQKNAYKKVAKTQAKAAKKVASALPG